MIKGSFPEDKCVSRNLLLRDPELQSQPTPKFTGWFFNPEIPTPEFVTLQWGVWNSPQILQLFKGKSVPYSTALRQNNEEYGGIKQILGCTSLFDNHHSLKVEVWFECVCVCAHACMHECVFEVVVYVHVCLEVQWQGLAETWEPGYSGCLWEGSEAKGQGLELFALLCNLNCLLHSCVTYKIGEGGMEGGRKWGRERGEGLSSVSLEPRWEHKSPGCRYSVFVFVLIKMVLVFFLIIHDCYTKLSNPTFVPKISLVYIVPNSSKHLKV